MDICNTLKSITNLNEYISATQDILNKCPDPKIQFNMSTVLAMKRIRSLEIEYFNKCDENGAAFVVFEQILRLPPSKTWGLLGVELISLVQYWLDALRKHLIFHNNHWWQFLNALLSFIEKIRLKSTSIRNVLVQETAECLLDLATNDKPDISQRYKIINCFNMCCADCSREIRISMRNKFTNYFTRIAHTIAECGDARTQLAGLESLLRWLLPRQDQQLRRRAAADWFPPRLYPPRCRDIFLERRWQNFSQDARDFLNAHNEGGERVLSVLCTRLTVGEVVVISEQDEKEYWLDINTGSRSMSLMLEPKQLEGLDGSSSDVLVIEEDNVEKLNLQGGGDSCVLRACLAAPPARPVSAALACAAAAVRRALRAALPNTHLIVTDIDSPNKCKEKPQCSDTDAKEQAEQATDARRTLRSGYIVRPRVPVSWHSPSTASTSSLAMLRDKLSAFSGLIFDKEPVSVCAVPQLSNVTELSESEEQRQFNSLSTLKLRPYGVCSKNRNNTESKRDKSDESVSETGKKCISPVVEDEESSVSCLLVATIGSANDSVLNDTLDRLPKDKDIHTDNIVDLLAKQALQYKRTSEVVNEANQVNTRDKNVLEEILCDPNASSVVEITKKDKKKPTVPKKQTVISNTTTDESNIDYVEDTPDCANKKKERITKNNLDSNKENFDNLIGLNQNFDNRDVELFFSQHINENCNRELVISPTLAQKINRSSSESSTEFDLLPHNIDNDFSINDIEIIECLNEMVDKVCKDLEKCTEYLDQDLNVFEQFNKEAGTSKKSLSTNNTNLNKMDDTDKDHTFSSQHPTSIKSFKLKFNSNNTKVTKNKTKSKKKMELEPIVETSQITENDNTIDNEHNRDHNNAKISNEPDKFKTPLMRRRRKLYSPKDDHVIKKEVTETTDLGSNKKITEESKPQQTNINQTKTSTPYKEIEKMRKTRILRNKSRKTESPLSPRSKKLNDMFDNLKNTIEGEKNVVFAKRNTRNRGAIYNFPSDSEDEDFKVVEIPKKSNKRTTNTSTAKSTGRSKLLKVEKPAPATNKRKNKRITRRSTKKFSEEDLEKPQMRFEQMRNAPPEALEVSFVAEVHNELENNDSDPVIAVLPTMETECSGELNENVPKQRRKKNVRTEIQSKETTNKLIIIGDKPEDKDITVSPLPGLVIETMPLKNDDKKDSISTCMLEGLNDISDDKHMSLLNNTLNLISDIEQVPNSNVYNIDDEVSVAASNDSKIKRNKFNLSTRKHKKSQKIKMEINKRNSKSSQKQSKKTVNLSSDSEKSIVTAGKSPITAHGDFNEAPPSFRQLNQRITEQRGLEVNDVNDTLQDYFKNLNNDINISSEKSNSTSKAKLIKGEPKKSTTVSNLSPAVTITRLSLSDIGKWIPPRYNSVFGSDESSSSSVTAQRNISTRASIHREKSADIEPVKNICESEKNEKMRLSAISPIKLFDDFQIDRGESIRSPSESIKNIECKKYQRNSEASSHRYELRSNRNLKYVNKKTKSKNSLTSVEESEGLRVPSVKRKSPTNTESPKRQKVSDTCPSIVQSASLPSVSSVEAWMAENIHKQTSATTDNLDLSLKDSVEIVLEKLDTTLLEIHHNTSKKFVNMFLGVQKRLADMSEERRRMYRAGGRELLADIVKLIDRKFLDLDHRSLEMDNQFMSSLREEARGLLREDCRQKRTMVALLRQDVQAARDHCGRAGQ